MLILRIVKPDHGWPPNAVIRVATARARYLVERGIAVYADAPIETTMAEPVAEKTMRPKARRRRG